MNVVYAPRALRDLQGISAYLVERSPAGASNVLAGIRSSINTLSYFPEIGPLVDDAGHRRMSVPRYPYVIFYRIDADDLFILHIRHTSRRPIDPVTDL
ncbi:MAG TPA: type II toxin-antitoxin system RelE/ParE family toxin [Xanthobacteraceae bacterium]|jgi:plasmid stabilization system protein ParE|nr:type II toxin-antitoxin system RelE/ParE family toxin [Xanthobacteraceae bacterium]